MEKNILPSVNCKMEKYFYLTSTIVLFLSYIVLFELVFALVLFFKVTIECFWTPGRGFTFNSGLSIHPSVRKSRTSFSRNLSFYLAFYISFLLRFGTLIEIEKQEKVKEMDFLNKFLVVLKWGKGQNLDFLLEVTLNEELTVFCFPVF